MGRPEEDPNRPFSVARVAVWALGIIAFSSVVGLIILGVTDGEISSALRSVVLTTVGALAAVASARIGRG